MWTRTELKSRAKTVLRNNYWKALIVSIVLLISGASHSFDNNFSWRNYNTKTFDYYISGLANKAVNMFDNIGGFGIRNALNQATYQTKNTVTTYVYRIAPNTGISRTWDYFSSSFNPIVLIIGFGLMFFGLIMIFFRLLVGYALEVGCRRYFTNAADNPKTDFYALGTAFRNGAYFNVLLTMFLRSLYTFLWSLLLVIPGIIKGLAYSLTPYILSDNPNISPSRAIELSQKMTYGHKWEIFVLKLSFIGWYILGSLCFGVGVIFVYPYENATLAELYLTLRNRLLDSGQISCEELCLTPVFDPKDTIDAAYTDPNHN